MRSKIKLRILTLCMASIMALLASCQKENKISVYDGNDASSETQAASVSSPEEQSDTETQRYIQSTLTNYASSSTERQTVSTSISGNSGTRSGIADVVDEIKDSVVAINITGTVTDYFFGTYPTEGSGSGVIISDDGYIVTNNHVISGGDSITVFLSNGEKHTAKLIGSDPKTDLAVVKIEKEGLKKAEIGVSSTLRVGDYAIAIGNPTGELQGTVSMGIISALDRAMVLDGVEMTMLQTDAAVSPGNSGGGLFDSNGTLIGIVTAKSKGSDVEGLGFVIPIDHAIPVIEDLINVGYVTGRPTLGFETVDITSRQLMRINGLNWMGVYINEVYSGTYAEQAGLKVRDYIKSADGEDISSGDRLKEIMDTKNIGDTIVLEIWRGDDIFDIVLMIDEEKNNN